ncbi:WecB/TagA/CpsF family glycosyltransferase [Bacteroides cutis]|jgi:N-acetylglucosaminyldiphosphoundecaprenol N-acetyl-beta-D-mannosaminyltransferase|uniref:WecB/TagA/CpsF family glycosyltransferase n=1 Tax=Bacteroides cutis TaxID=2024197 RepID=UPI0023A8794D|nr:WecB/TagA/CpsF family glycosyltransferase [Bacteroides cutis]
MKICNIDINCLSKQDLFQENKGTKIVVTVNAEAIVRSQSDCRLKKIISENISTIDGQIPLWLCKMVSSSVKIEKLSGSDIIYDYCSWAETNNYRVFLLGGNEKSNKEALIQLRIKYPRLVIEGYSPEYSPYPFKNEINDSILSSIIFFSPEILFVGFGMGKQEFWADDNLSSLAKIGVKYIIGCGGTFDFVSGRVKRAPLLVQRLGLEGIWRFLVEPKFFRLRRLLMSCRIFYYFFKYDLLNLNSKD